MHDYTKKLIGSLLDDMKESKHTAAPEYLFWTDDGEEATKLLAELSNLFHKVTAQELWINKHIRPDLQIGTSLLCTRVQFPDKHEYKKPQHQMMYL